MKTLTGHQTKAESALEFINKSIASGRTVYICTHYQTTVISPKTFAKWEKAGNKLFMIDNEGNLRMARGKHFDIIVTRTIAMVGIKSC